ncbi:MAG: type II toxin-antitoxin system MqsA family antitoxin [Aggregatilineales bacterium]
MAKRAYPCEFCDTDKPQEDKLVTLTLTREGRWYIFENVPAHVCPNCGHRYYNGPMILELEQMIDHVPPQARPVEAWAIALPVSK